MSIDPLKAGAIQPQLERPPGRANNTDKQRVFELALKGAVAGADQPGIVAEQADTMLKLAQLQLLQGLFDVDEEAGYATDYIGLLGLQRNSASLPVAGQNVDKIYSRMQPTLLEPDNASRSDIEKMIDQVAEKVSLAPELIHAVVAAESDFQPHAVSPVGAQGLMQLMPATAAELGVQDSFDPRQNLLGGSQYLKQLLNKYDGDLDSALAAYNWGQGNVDRKGLAQMPQETRDYLARVKGLLDKQV
jgi:hypothetical protein